MRTLVVVSGSRAALDWAQRTAGLDGTVRLANGDGDAGDDALIEAADRLGADAVVVGRDRRGFATSAGRPVVVVPDRLEGVARSLEPGATVVVGIGHGPATRAALVWAAGLARRRDLALSLVRAVSLPSLLRVEGLAELLAYTIDPGALHEWAEQDLAELAEEVHRLDQDHLPITWRTRSGRAGPALVDAASSAALLVVGVHRGSLVDLANAPALRHVLDNAPCPVAVIPAVDE